MKNFACLCSGFEIICIRSMECEIIEANEANVEFICFIHVTYSKPTNYLLATLNVWWLPQMLKRKQLKKSWYLIRREDENDMIHNLDSSHWTHLEPCIMLNVNLSCQHCANLIVSYTIIISKSQSLDLVQYFWVTENTFTVA